MLIRISAFIYRWKLFPVYTILLILLSVLPINGPGSQINHIFIVHLRLDYIIHALVYIPLTILAWSDRRIDFYALSLKTAAWIIGLLVFAAVTEWIQFFLPYRAFNINDLIANSLGIIVGLIIVMITGAAINK